MNILRQQKPYVFYPPKYAAWFRPVIHLLTDWCFLARQFKTQITRVEGGERLAELSREGHAVMLAPNHADHADPSVLHSTCRRLGMQIHFMAAREGFERSRLAAFILQKAGAFSVDREGSDLSAVRTAIEILVRGDHPLVIFPEGEIWHHHELLDELNPGTTTILLRSARKLAEGKKAYLVPCCLRYFHAPEVEATFNERMTALEQALRWKPRPNLPIVDRIYRFGNAMLASREVEFLGAPQQGTLIERSEAFQEKLLSRIEDRWQLPHRDKRNPERVRDLRNHIRKVLADENPAPDSERWAELYDDLDTLFLAVQLYSYPMNYVRSRPTLHRIAETLLKLEEDILGKGRYPTHRTVSLRFDEPIDVAAYLQENHLDHRTGVAPLTALLCERIQALLDQEDDPGA